jgi:hypothetical protein
LKTKHFCFALVFALFFAACDQGGGFWDDGSLNPGLVGTWFHDFGDNYTDKYIIEGTRLEGALISHTTGWPSFASATIGFVYNFSDDAGCLIIERETDKYTAVYYKSLSADSVILGDAYTVADYTIDPAVATLELAKTKFAPGNRDLYGGDLANASPLERVH